MLVGRTASAMNHRFELGRAGVPGLLGCAPSLLRDDNLFNHIDRSRLPAPQPTLRGRRRGLRRGGHREARVWYAKLGRLVQAAKMGSRFWHYETADEMIGNERPGASEIAS
jgi:hypothetical protein